MALNGRLDDRDLARIPGTNRLIRADLAGQFGAWREAFHWKFAKPMMITDAYRPYEGNPFAQVEIMLARYKPLEEFQRRNPRMTVAAIKARKSHVWNGERRYLLPGAAQAAFPGTSNHGWATATDLGSGINVRGSREHTWAVATAPMFGFRWPSEWASRAREWWHFEDGAVVPASRYRLVPGVLNIPTVGEIRPALLEEDPLADLTPEKLQQIAAAVWECRCLNGETAGGNLASIRPEIASVPGEVLAAQVGPGGSLSEWIQSIRADFQRSDAITRAQLTAALAALSALAGAAGTDPDAVLRIVDERVATALAEPRTVIPAQRDGG